MIYRFLFLILACCTFVSCSSDKVPFRLCPQVASLRELDRIEDHGRDEAIPSTLVAVATMKRIDGQCLYEKDGVEVTFDLSMEAQKGPRLGGNQANFPFFISLVSPEGTVLSKEIMTESFTFEEEKDTAEKVEPLRVFIPLDENEDASTYRVLTGFQLTPEQVAVLRKEK